MLGMTVCSGVGAPEVAAPWVDWRYQSEIEPFPCAVLAERFPNAVNLGDMTKFQEWPDANVDVLCGGTPCQAFSVAGLRKGLADPRGNLMLTYLAIAARYRPRWIVWENVFGVLSSNGGRDFGAFLGGVGELGYGFAYRVLDVQFGRTLRFPLAIPQRRRRVFVVGYLGDWRRAAAVLFDRESLSGNPPPRREAGQIAAPTLSARTNGGDGQVAGALTVGGGRPGHGYPAVAFDLRGRDGGAQFEGPHETANIRAASGGSSRSYVAEPWAVRRLTPTECERLQGFPDGWTQIAYRNKPADKCPDGPRYKALGNSWGVNAGEYVFDRIRMVEGLA